MFSVQRCCQQQKGPVRLSARDPFERFSTLLTRLQSQQISGMQSYSARYKYSGIRTYFNNLFGHPNALEMPAFERASAPVPELYITSEWAPHLERSRTKPAVSLIVESDSTSKPHTYRLTLTHAGMMRGSIRVGFRYWGAKSPTQMANPLLLGWAPTSLRL